MSHFYKVPADKCAHAQPTYIKYSKFKVNTHKTYTLYISSSKRPFISQDNGRALLGQTLSFCKQNLAWLNRPILV